ncbi:transcriptional regulator, NifA subfamily, Fis Family [Rhodopirellula sallentina SM41]|uniref:Transcriptional regulator, NifA subfamily, Fis Family n=1 Tax=Rhodopirellula sallentina SM41 TaxID=1263870 RepID=M5U3K7_9BACT|nr:transcriptional regulator, NifA subfamily, Fis Family [Rhodopirellula sallentina SM41]
MTSETFPKTVRSLFDCSPVSIYVARNDRVTYANPAFYQLVGRSSDEVIGAALQEIVWHVSSDRLSGPQPTPFGSRDALRFRVTIPQEDGSVLENEIIESRFGIELHDDDANDAFTFGMVVPSSHDPSQDQEHRDQLDFEKLLVELSACFVNVPSDEIDQRIDESLQSLVDFLGNDRSTFFEFSSDRSRILITNSVSTTGCDTFPVGDFPVSELPWFIEQFREGEFVFLRDVMEELPESADQERKYCRAHGIQSNVAVPLRVGGESLGGLTFAFMRQRCDWSREVIMRLNLIGEVFANALLRRKNENALRTALEENTRLRKQLEQDNLYLREKAELTHHYDRIVGHSDAITRVLANVEQVAPTDAPVLLTGETGTGKELIAQTLHELSPRKDRPMVVVNCASLPATLIESELFGRAAGAYTGAASAQIGRFELADGSTLFLDEIGELPLELQAKLLRVLQDGRFERLGTAKTISVDVRIIAATNRDLEVAMRENQFRSDLYHRINVFPIQVPPLRNRREDIPSLTWAFVETHGRKMGKSVKRIPRSAMQRLQEYTWPGNVRELSNTVERAMILCNSDTLNIEPPSSTRDVSSPSKTLKEAERDQILCVLRDTGWRIRGRGGAAERLDVKPTTLEARMSRLGIKRPNRE